MNRKERRATEKRHGRGVSINHAATGIGESDTTDLMAEANRCYQLGRLVEAQGLCRRTLASEPAHFNALNLLGVIAQFSGDHKLAVKMFAKAIASDQLNAACHYNIANSYQALDRRAEAVTHFKVAIELGMNDKSIEGLILQSPLIAGVVDRISRKWPVPIAREELFDASGTLPIASDTFLLCVLETAIIKNLALEILLTRVRSELLRLALAGESGIGDVDDAMAGLFCALAQQCFINEYVFDQSDKETEGAAQLWDLLRQKLEDGDDVLFLLLTAVAAYFPLFTLPRAERLLNMNFSAPATALLQHQVREPLEEAGDRGSIPVLTAIEDDVSLRVMRQYEESPYPRWTINPLALFAADRAHDKTADSEEHRAKLDILVAGCGTGQHAVLVAQIFPNARVLAIDLSLPSLAYARRKTRELGLRSIEYAQADILNLATLGRTFDRIEAVGVLHHLADPKAGWRVLLSLLRPEGAMRVGLYSEAARHVIAQARTFSAQRGYRAMLGDIRKCRQEIVREANSPRWRALIGSKDFYSMSGCRDLLFNVMEHRFSIPEIAAFLTENNLSFLGFEFTDDPDVIGRFQQHFTDAAALTNLENWHAFELSNPDTFWGMYLFSVRMNWR